MNAPFSHHDSGAAVIRRFFCLFFVLLVCIWCPTVQAGPRMQPGFRTLGIWESATGVRLDLAIWYPAGRSPSKIDYGDWILTASRGATPLPGPFPLILLSHDSGGSRFSLHQLGAELASNGFVVAAPTHAGDNTDDMTTLFFSSNVTERARQLSLTLDLVLSHPELASLVDPQRIGVLGVGPGGTAALLLAGARLDGKEWASYCQETERDDPYCTPWARQRMNLFAASADPGQSFRDRRVRAAAAVAPAYPMLFTKDSLSMIRIPILFLRAEKVPLYTLPHAERLLQKMPAPPRLGFLPDADTASLMSSCGETLAQSLPELCLADDSKRETVQLRLGANAVLFFNEHIAAPELAPLPPEPEDTPQVKKPEPVKDTPSKKRK